MTASPAGNVSTLRKKLHDSLARLQQTVKQSERQLAESDDVFRQWQEQWDQQGEELAERLRMLDRRLQETLGDSGVAPTFNVVGG